MKTAIVLLVAIAIGAGGGCAASTRSDTLHAALVAHDAIEASFVAYDRSHQLSIVAAATSHAQGAVALKAYQARAAHVETALNTALHAIAALGDVNDQPHIDGVKAALAELAAAYTDLTGAAAPSGGAK